MKSTIYKSEDFYSHRNPQYISLILNLYKQYNLQPERIISYTNNYNLYLEDYK